MKTVYKITLDLTEHPQSVIMPVNSKIVHVALQDGLPTLWYEYQRHQFLPSNMEVTFRVNGTGWAIADNEEYIGTAVGDNFVWHVYRLKA